MDNMGSQSPSGIDVRIFFATDQVAPLPP
jgi:hypothetical protein